MSIIKKEYYSLNKDEPTIGLLMMLKNEQKRLHVTLNSILGHVDAIIVYDTGSTDDTIQILQDFSEKHRINLYIKIGTFEDFATSRNISLDFADTVNVHYLLLLDCNDELRGGDILRKNSKDFMNKDTNGFLLCQQWWNGQMNKYYNVRFVKNRCGWRYKGAVHEWIRDTLSDTDQPRFEVYRFTEEITLFQDRTLDDDKSSKRFARDREVLLREYIKDPKEPRTLFYLAQTCQCLGYHDEALYYSKLRLNLIGFFEERFHALLRCGDSCVILGHEWDDCMKWYVKAYEEFQRVEPLIKIAEYYKDKASRLAKENKYTFNIWRTAYIYIQEACKLSYPENCILFVDKGKYDYYRWHLMGIIAFFAQEIEVGKQACIKAIAQGNNKEVDEKNLQFYLEFEKKSKQVNTISSDIKCSKQQFIAKTVGELQKQYPKLTQTQLVKKANTIWKKRPKN